MVRTFSATPPAEGEPDDFDGLIVDGVESLRQRVAQRLRFPLGSWELDRRLGTDSLLGHDVTVPLAGSVIRSAILDEGGDEVLGVSDLVVEIDHATRRLRFSVVVVTVYGSLPMAGSLL